MVVGRSCCGVTGVLPELEPSVDAVEVPESVLPSSLLLSLVVPVVGAVVEELVDVVSAAAAADEVLLGARFKD